MSPQPLIKPRMMERGKCAGDHPAQQTVDDYPCNVKKNHGKDRRDHAGARTPCPSFAERRLVETARSHLATRALGMDKVPSIAVQRSNESDDDGDQCGRSPWRIRYFKYREVQNELQQRLRNENECEDKESAVHFAVAE